MDVYVERRDFLVMDHVWLNGRHVKIFETNLGNGKFSSKHPPPRSIMTKWHDILTLALKLKWGTYGIKLTVIKKVHFIWSM